MSFARRTLQLGAVRFLNRDTLRSQEITSSEKNISLLGGRREWDFACSRFCFFALYGSKGWCGRGLGAFDGAGWLMIDHSKISCGCRRGLSVISRPLLELIRRRCNVAARRKLQWCWYGSSSRPRASKSRPGLKKCITICIYMDVIRPGYMVLDVVKGIHKC